MKQLHDGTITTYRVEDGKDYLGHAEDMTHHLKDVHELARDRVRSERMGDMPHLMRVPNVVAYKIMNETGLNFFDADDFREIYKILARDYPVLKVTPHNL